MPLRNLLSFAKSRRPPGPYIANTARDKIWTEDECGGRWTENGVTTKWVFDGCEEVYWKLRVWLYRELGCVQAEMHVSMQVVWDLRK